MMLHPSPIAAPGDVSLAHRRSVIRRESLRDCAGVAVGVAAGALVWLTYLSLIRF